MSLTCIISFSCSIGLLSITVSHKYDFALARTCQCGRFPFLSLVITLQRRAGLSFDLCVVFMIDCLLPSMRCYASLYTVPLYLFIEIYL